MQRKTVLLIFGGESSEHDVSVASAHNVFAAIDDTLFNVELAYIDRAGKWWLLDRLSEDLTTHGAPQLVPVLGAHSFVTFPSSRVIKPDVILPILHGRNGEDGSVQGLAQLLHVPIVGCDVTASALCMDKLVTKEILSDQGIRVVPYEIHRKADALPDFSQLSMRLGSPVFIKPAKEGSSVGVSKIYTEEEFASALTLAHQYDDVALIERGISGRELEVALLGNPPAHEVSMIGEIQPREDFYTYNAKYAADSTTKVIIPADLDEDTISRVQLIAKNTYEILGCKGLSRIDFFLGDDGTVYVNEINTLPGFTNISMYPKLWRHEGISYSKLIERLIVAALPHEEELSADAPDITL